MAVKGNNEEEMLDDDEENEDTQEGKYLTFMVDKEEYGIEIRHVTEIIGILNITEVPDRPSYVMGVINLRGKVLPVMDVRLRFNLPKREYDDRTCIIVININGETVGLIVDRVAEVLDIPKSEIAESPKVNKGESSKYIKGIGKVGDKVKILLNVDALLFDAVAVNEAAAVN
jgi:purine-binding chemotaxis protein CheW